MFLTGKNILGKLKLLNGSDTAS